MGLKSRKESLGEFKDKLRKEYPVVYKLFMECVEGNRREFVSMVMFAKKIGAPEPVIGALMTEYLNKIWPYVERYKP